MFKQGNAVAPISNLDPCCYHQGKEHNARRNPNKPLLIYRFYWQQVGNPPCKHHTQSDEREIGIPICPGLPPHLNNSDHWQKRCKIPEPTNEKIRMCLV